MVFIMNFPLSHDEIIRKLIIFFRAKYGIIVRPRTNVFVLAPTPAERTRLSNEINELDWVRAISTSPLVHSLREDTTVRTLANELYGRQYQQFVSGGITDNTRGCLACGRACGGGGGCSIGRASPRKKARRAPVGSAPKEKARPKKARAGIRTDKSEKMKIPAPKKTVGAPLIAGVEFSQHASSVEAKTKIRTSLSYKLWFGTNRKPIDPKNLAKGFSGKRDSKMHLGNCTVYVPESHKIGSTGSAWWKRLLAGVDDRLKLTNVEELPSQKFWEGVSSQLKQVRPGDRDAVIFVHGYNVSYDDCALRAAQLGTDLAIKGCMAFFSWPSRGKTREYIFDEASIEASEPFIAQFMVDFAERSGASKIHIIAHSMGNRGVLRAVDRIASSAAQRSSIPFDQIILAAPDVDADTFRELCKAYTKVSRRTTLYVSSRDKAVEAAKWLHGYARAGLLPPVMVSVGIDTVNVTNADLTMLGHGYVAEARGVLSDMHSLLRFGAAPTKRFGLQRQKSEDGKIYWMIGQ
jgi:esterase/lipase superfamily enzyme